MRLRSIRSKIMVSILCITFFAVISIAAVFYKESAQLIEENYVTALSQKMQLLMETVDERMEDVCDTGRNAACDENITNSISSYLKTEDEKELERIAEELRGYQNRERSVASLYFLIPETAQIITSMDYPVYKSNMDRDKIKEYVQMADQESGPVIMDDMVNNEKKTVSFIEKVKDTEGRTAGYIFTNIEEHTLFYDYFYDDFEHADEAELSELLLLNQNQIITSKRTFELGKRYTDYGKYKQYFSGKDVTGADQKYVYVYCEGDFSGCGIFAQAEKKEILSGMSGMKARMIEMTILVMLISLLPAAYLAQVISNPARKLVSAIKKGYEGELDARAEVSSYDEIGIISEEFNRMLDQIQELVQQVMEEEKMKKNAELEALQYQITPHFMYNTLNSIKCSALMKGEKETAQMIEDFVEVLQTCTSKKGAFLTVAEECHILEKYIHLQEFRSGEKILSEYEIQTEAKMCLIPRLILQPLAENAFIHGMDRKGKQGRLEVRAWVEKNTLYMEVKDNGRGMTQEQISNLLANKKKKTKGLTAVGVSNVRDRLKLYYKDKAELSYHSSSSGTTATIYLPEIRNEE